MTTSVVLGVLVTLCVVAPPAAAEPLELNAPHVPSAPASLDDSAWEAATPLQVPVTFQVMALPWGKHPHDPMWVRALHDGVRIAFRLEWTDPTEDRVSGANRFPDACAVMLPIGESSPPSLMMGFLHPVNIWHWRANREQPAPPGPNVYVDYHAPFDQTTILGNDRERIVLTAGPHALTPVEELIATGPGTIRANAGQRVVGSGVYGAGTWRVLVSRHLAADGDDEAPLRPGQQTAVAFAVWDGARKERGSRKAISEWVALRLR